MHKSTSTITFAKEVEINTAKIKEHELDHRECYHSPQCVSRQPTPPPIGPLTLEQVNLNDEIEKHEKSLDALVKTVCWN